MTFRLDYQTGSASPQIFWSWREKNEGLYYRVDKDLSALAGKKVKFTLTVLASGTATGDRALWSQPRIVRTTSVPPTPTATTTPPGSVSDINTSVRVPDSVNCAGNVGVDLLGSITTNGPATVKYHWEISGTVNNSTPENTLVFSSASTQPANLTGYILNCGSYVAKLVVTSPNALSTQTAFTLSIPTLLPIYDFNTFGAIGTLACSDVTAYAWRQEPCNGESGGCWIAQPSIFGNTYAGFFRHDANTICGMNLP